MKIPSNPDPKTLAVWVRWEAAGHDCWPGQDENKDGGDGGGGGGGGGEGSDSESGKLLLCCV